MNENVDNEYASLFDNFFNSRKLLIETVVIYHTSDLLIIKNKKIKKSVIKYIILFLNLNVELYLFSNFIVSILQSSVKNLVSKVSSIFNLP